MGVILVFMIVCILWVPFGSVIELGKKYGGVGKYDRRHRNRHHHW